MSQTFGFGKDSGEPIVNIRNKWRFNSEKRIVFLEENGRPTSYVH